MHTHASRNPSSRVPFLPSTPDIWSRRSSNAFVRVISSFFSRFLNAITSCCSAMRERSGGGVMYVREDGSFPSLERPPEKPPNDPKPPTAARLLEAWDLNFLLMWGMRSAAKDVVEESSRLRSCKSLKRKAVDRICEFSALC